MMKDVQSSLLVMEKALGHRQRMRVPGFTCGVKGGDLLSINELRRFPRDRHMSRTVFHSKAAVALDDEG